MKLSSLLNEFYNVVLHISHSNWDDLTINSEIKEGVINKGKQFLQWLIDNNHIEKIGEGEINDYIRYIATTEDPIQTLSDLIK